MRRQTWPSGTFSPSTLKIIELCKRIVIVSEQKLKKQTKRERERRGTAAAAFMRQQNENKLRG